MDKIRIKATLLSIFVVLLLIGYFLFNALESKKRTLDEKMHNHRELLQNPISFPFLMLKNPSIILLFKCSPTKILSTRLKLETEMHYTD
jgi:hypothetical protein